MGKFYAIITIIGLGIAGLSGYHWYETVSNIQTFHVDAEERTLTEETNTTLQQSSLHEGREITENEVKPSFEL